MSTDEKEVNAGQKTKHRSPAHPIIAIDDAIERLKLIYKQDKRAFTTFEAILDHLGYEAKKRSGTSARVVAALRQYGLLDERNKQFRVSDLGWKILETEEGAEGRGELLKEAALNPPIIREIIKHYNGELPSDATLRSHLVLQRKFNPDSVKDFIRVLRRTVDIANPSPEDYTAGEESEGAEQPQDGGRPMSQQSPPFTGRASSLLNQPAAYAPASPAGMVFPLYLSQGRQGSLIIPPSMTKQDLKLLKTQIDNHLAVAEATALVEDEPTRADEKADEE